MAAAVRGGARHWSNCARREKAARGRITLQIHATAITDHINFVAHVGSITAGPVLQVARAAEHHARLAFAAAISRV